MHFIYVCFIRSLIALSLNAYRMQLVQEMILPGISNVLINNKLILRIVQF